MTATVLDAPPRQRATEFHLFGPDTLVRDGQPVPLSTNGPRQLLTLLLLSPEGTATLAELQKVLPPTVPNLATGEPIVEELNSALSGTGVAIAAAPRNKLFISGDSGRPTFTSSYQLVGTPVEADLDRCGALVKAAILTADAYQASEYVAAASQTIQGFPLEGLSAFDEEQAYLIDAQQHLAALHESLMRLGSEESLRSVWAHFAEQLRHNFVSDRWGLPAAFTGFVIATETLLTPDSVYHSTYSNVVAGLARNLPSFSVFQSLTPYKLGSAMAGVDMEPVSIYLGDGHRAEAVEAALTQLLDDVGMETFGHEPPIHGSWFRQFKARAKAKTAHLGPEQVAAELERKLRIELFDKQQAAIDNQQAAGAAALITALQGEERACIRVGSLLVLKIDGQVLVNNLTQYQLAWLERNQVLLRNPEGLLQGLDELAAHEHQDMAGLPGRAAERQPLPVEAHE